MTVKKGKAEPNFCGHVIFNEVVNGNARISSFIEKAVRLKDFDTIVRKRFGTDLLTIEKRCDGLWSAASCTPSLWIKIHRASEPCPEGWTTGVHIITEAELEPEGDKDA